MQDLQDLGIIPDAEKLGARDLPSTCRLGNPGGFSETFEHPTDPSLAVRIAEHNDGWISYALDNHGSPHAPRLDQLGWYKDRWIAVVERLLPFDPSNIKHKALKDVVMVMLESDMGLTADDVAACGRFEGLSEYLEQFRGRQKLDRHLENVMIREVSGSQMPIFNDPISVTPEERIPLLQDAWLVELPVIEDPFVADTEIGAPPRPNGPR